jgi:hypothetical protein
LGAAVAVLLASQVVGCGGKVQNNDPAAAVPIEECEGFLGAYARCLRAGGDQAIVAARLEQTRAALTAQASGDAAAREQARRQCADNLSHLNATCR